ncbi:MAG: FAD-dependent oxidoreductase [Actinomycetota bacterium]|nr:FAD-dependent oxidoreductase [Actinomycetota bacterium]
MLRGSPADAKVEVLGMTLPDQTWDLVVVGGGTAGIVGAKTAARFGARVALVERARTGGDCLWTGCVPSKALLAAAAAAAHARQAHRLGVEVSDVTVNFGAVMRHVHQAIAAIEPVDSPAALRAAGVHVISGEARFVSPNAVRVGDQRLRFSQALLATGAAPAVPDLPGLREAAPLTSDTVWDLQRLPQRLVVMGGGTIGCELGQAFARLGAQVTVVEAGDRLLANEDPDASALVQAALESDGVHVLPGHSVVRVAGRANGSGEVSVQNGDSERSLLYDALLVAVGRRPRTCGLGLTAAGVDLDERGMVKLDPTLRTTNPSIWAAGDLTGHPQFTHLAGVHASLAVTNAVLGLRRKVRADAVPRVTFTDPEVGAVGASAWQEQDAGYRTVTRSHADVDRAVTEDRIDGFTRLVLDSRHRIVGATVVGPRAGEALAELGVAVTSGMKTSGLAGTTHAYPTYADGSWNAAIEDVQGRLDAPAVRVLAGLIVRGRRAWKLLRRPTDPRAVESRPGAAA